MKMKPSRKCSIFYDENKKKVKIDSLKSVIELLIETVERMICLKSLI